MATTLEPVTIPARGGKAVLLKAGQRIKIINTHGQQVVDTWAFNVNDTSEYLSMQHTRAYLDKVIPAAGDDLVSPSCASWKTPRPACTTPSSPPATSTATSVLA